MKLKSWNIRSKEGKKLLRAYYKHGVSMSCAMQKDSPKQKQIICDLIDIVHGKIYLEWDGKYVSKKKAKEYVLGINKVKGGICIKD